MSVGMVSCIVEIAISHGCPSPGTARITARADDSKLFFFPSGCSLSRSPSYVMSEPRISFFSATSLVSLDMLGIP